MRIESVSNVFVNRHSFWFTRDQCIPRFYPLTDLKVPAVEVAMVGEDGAGVVRVFRVYVNGRLSALLLRNALFRQYKRTFRLAPL